jgi:chromate transport protein ChrA
VQGLELILISTGIIVAVAHIVAQYLDRGGVDHPVSRLLLGVIPAVIGVVLVVVDRMDLIPDSLERPLWVIVVVLISGALVLGTSYRLARH